MKLKIIAICSTLAFTFAIAAEAPPRGGPSVIVRGAFDAASVAELATNLAAALANKEARKRFDAEPFIATTEKAVFRSGRWEWQSIAGYQTGDLRATVSFRANGSEPVVDVAMLLLTR